MIEGVVLVAPNKIVHIRVGVAGIDALRWAPKSAVLLVLMGYTRGRTRCTGLAQMLGRRLLFPHIMPINGLCTYGLCRPHLRPL